MKNFTNYVLGFAFSRDKRKVLLIEKQRPPWQKGFINGIGGKCERNEKPFAAIVREFREETGLESYGTWIFCGEIVSRKYNVSIFCSFTTDIDKAKNLTDEMLFTYYIGSLETYLFIDNIKSLINLCLLKEKDSTFDNFTLSYNDEKD